MSLISYFLSSDHMHFLLSAFHFFFFFFFLNDTPPPEIYPLPLHDALPIWPGAPQIGYGRGVEEPGPTEICGGEKKWPAPPGALEPVRNRGRARPAVVERQQQRRRSVLAIHFLDDTDRPIHRQANRREMIVELRRRQLVARCVAAGKPARVLAACGHHVVVHQRGGFHQQMPR